MRTSSVIARNWEPTQAEKTEALVHRDGRPFRSDALSIPCQARDVEWERTGPPVGRGYRAIRAHQVDGLAAYTPMYGGRRVPMLTIPGWAWTGYYRTDGERVWVIAFEEFSDQCQPSA